jgi:hypothetical protein
VWSSENITVVPLGQNTLEEISGGRNCIHEEFSKIGYHIVAWRKEKELGSESLPKLQG